MITKEQMAEAILSLPEGATVRDAIEHLEFIELIERRIAEADDGNVVSHEDARRRFAAWLE